MENKLYVGNLSYSTSEAALEALFGQAGTVKSVQVIKDRETGRSKGFAFVEMANQEEAQKAIALCNGKELDGRALTVNIARPREERAGGGDDRRRSGGFSNDRNRNNRSSGGNRGGGRSW